MSQTCPRCGAAFPRLSPGEKMDALSDFAIDRLGDRCDPDKLYDFIEGCEVLYRWDLSACTVEYQVVDERGHGDGTNEWVPLLHVCARPTVVPGLDAEDETYDSRLDAAIAENDAR